MFQASTTRWRDMAVGLALLPVLSMPAVAQAPAGRSASDNRTTTGGGAAVSNTAPGTEQQARELVARARKALKEGQSAEAVKLAQQADKLEARFQFWEDSPKAILADVSRLSPGRGSVDAPIGRATSQGPTMARPNGARPPAPAAQPTPSAVKPVSATASAPSTAPDTAGDPRGLVKLARQKLQQGELDEAKRLAAKANVAGVRWSLFEDTPAKVMDAVTKARTTKDREDSVKLLAQARTLFQQGKLEEARQTAIAAENKHGPYSIWDLGDRPHKLIAEIEVAQASNKTVKLPPAPVVAKAPAPTTPATPTAPKTTTAQAAPQPDLPPSVVPVAAQTPEKPTAPVVATAQVPAAPAPARPPVVMPAAAPVPAQAYAPAPTPPVHPQHGRGVALVKEARSLQTAGRLLEARAKAIEAQQLGPVFSPGDDRPEQVILEVTSASQQQIAALLRDADQVLASGNAPAIMNQAEAKLAEARSLAASFGLDQQAIDTRTASVQRMRQQMTVAAAPAPPAVIPAVAQKPATPAMPLPVPVPVSNPGEEMLSKAALELRSGNTDAARRIAEEVYRGPYQLQDKALAMIRSAAAEENNQRILAADRAFSTAKTAMQSRDYRQADALLKQIDPAMLSPEKQRLYGEYVQTARTETRKAEQAQAAAAPKPTLIPVAAVGGTGPVPGVALTGEAGSAESFAKQVEALQTIEFQRFREDGLKIQREATALFQKGETDASIQMLADYIASVKASSLEPSRVGLLTRSADHRMQQFKMLKAQQDFETRQRVGKEEWRDKREKKILGEEQKHQQVKALMSESRQLLDEGKYREAEMKAMQANELDPDDPSTGAAVKIAQVLRNQAQFDEVKKRSERLFVDALDDAEDVGPSVNSKSPVALDAETFKRAKGRASLTGIGSTRPRSDREREIERRLTAPVSLNFSNVPLRQAIEEMRAMTGINIIPDMPALEEDRVSMETPVTMKLDNVSLKSSLNLLLGQVKLTYVVKDEVLQVTTERHARGKLSTRTFSVADLVIPVDNYAMPAHSNLAKLFEDRQNKGNFQMINNQLTASGAGQAVGQPLGQGGSMNPTMTANGSLPGGVTPSGPMAASSIQTNAVNTLENQLIRLITSTIAPNSWSDVGGAGTIQYFPLGMAMVIGQTPDVQEQVADLLEALRRLQDLEVSVELRLISLSESFFERIGLDFNINIKTDKSTRKIEPQLINAQNPGGSAVKAPGQIQDLTTKGVILGLTPAGTFTNDLDIPIRSSSFEYAIPPFGGYPNIPGANGGLSLGMAFLNDIQVFMFMEAAQGDKRVNVMQAPKLTLFNGQSATINVQEFQFFVTNVALYSLNGQLAFLPENTPLPLGLAMTVQAVVSADRRFVRLNLAPQLNNLALGSAQVPLFPVTSFITPTFDGGFQGQPIPFTQFVQQPNLTTISIQTTVSVPDGGTVLLGGLKTLSEGRNEFGPPVLSKVPYINRLFKNVGYGREAQSLLLMVTPRIIINAEEEDRQTGVGPTGPQAQ